jgi:serine protease inhibitor
MSFWKGLWRTLESQGKPPEVLQSAAWEAESSGVVVSEASNAAIGGTTPSVQSFGLRLLAEETARAQEANVLISPLSVFLTLAMAENGAVGETKMSIRKALALPANATEETLHALSPKLLKSVETKGEAELAIANAMGGCAIDNCG